MPGADRIHGSEHRRVTAAAPVHHQHETHDSLGAGAALDKLDFNELALDYD